jgi:hypothetical protein
LIYEAAGLFGLDMRVFQGDWDACMTEARGWMFLHGSLEEAMVAGSLLNGDPRRIIVAASGFVIEVNEVAE